MRIVASTMTKHKIYFSVLPLIFALIGCGGGSSSAPVSITGNIPGGLSGLSDDQRVFESTFLESKGGAYDISWTNGDISTINPIDALKYFTYHHISISSAPIAGESVHINAKAYEGLDKELGSIDQFNAYLQDGKIIYANTNSSANNNFARYDGARIQFNLLATDNKTIAQSIYLENFRTYPLTGNIANTVIVEENSHLAGLRAFAKLRNPTRAYLPNSQAVAYSSRLAKDTYMILDCRAFFNAELTPVSPCPIKSTLQSALTTGIGYIGKTYYAADGVISQVGGKSVWISLQPQTNFGPFPKPIQEMFTFFFEQDGQIYGGNLTKAGQVLSGSYAYNIQTGKSLYLNYSVMFNKNGRDSLRQVVLAP